MMEASGLYGMYGMGGYGATDPSQMKNMMMARMLLTRQSTGAAAGTPAGALGNAGNNVLAYLLSNPDALKKYQAGAGNLGTGIGNLATGSDWGGYGMSTGLPNAGALQGLSSQAANYSAAGAPGL